MKTLTSHQVPDSGRVIVRTIFWKGAGRTRQLVKASELDDTADAFDAAGFDSTESAKQAIASLPEFDKLASFYYHVTTKRQAKAEYLL